MTIPRIADYPMPKPASFPANRTAWRPDPKRAVLLIHDMQRYFLRYYDAEGVLLPSLIGNLVTLRDWAHANGIPVVYTAQPHEQSAADRALLNDMWGPGLSVADAGLQTIAADLAPGPEDVVLTKWRYSAFKRSDLAERMQSWKRDQLLIGGVYAHIGCMVTAIDAFMSDIQAFMVGDAVADFSEAEHRMALQYVATRCGALVATTTLAGSILKPPSRAWLEARVQAFVDEDQQVDPDENLIFYGLDSIQVMKLATDLRERGIMVGFDDLARVPTLNAWWSLIERQSVRV